MKNTLLILFIALSLAACGSHADSHKSNQAASDHSNYSTMDHSTKDHSSMESSPAAADADQSLQFIDSMIAHHQRAIDMANLGTTNAGRPEMKKFTLAIIPDQDREITQMKRWRNEWYKDAKPAINMDFPGMREGMDGGNVSRLRGLSGNDFDLEFTRQLIPHHEGAVLMSKHLLAQTGKDAARPELRKLAEAIIKSDTDEIEQMRKWIDAWQ